jgi:oligogalacturonide transport system substrate-binding protein
MLDQGILQGYFLPDYIRNKTGNFWVTDDYAIKASKEDLTEAFTVMKSFFDSGAAAPFGETSIINTKLETYQRFINNQIGMTEDMSGAIAKYKGVVKPENFGVASAVTVKDGKDTTTLYKPSMLFAVNAKSANKDEAVKFTNWMLNDKEAAGILKDCRSTPASAASRQVLKDANALDKDVTQMVEATLKNPAQPMPLVINNAEIADITKDVISKVIFNKLTPDKGADELISRVTSKLNELKTKK